MQEIEVDQSLLKDIHTCLKREKQKGKTETKKNNNLYDGLIVWNFKNIEGPQFEICWTLILASLSTTWDIVLSSSASYFTLTLLLFTQKNKQDLLFLPAKQLLGVGVGECINSDRLENYPGVGVRGGYSLPLDDSESRMSYPCVSAGLTFDLTCVIK